MRRPVLVLAAMLAAGASPAQPVSAGPPATTIQCLEADGRSVPAACRASGSRLDPREEICTCQAGGQRVEVAVCAPGQAAPPEGRTLNIARREAARDGSLLGDTVGGRPICVAPRNR